MSPITLGCDSTRMLDRSSGSLDQDYPFELDLHPTRATWTDDDGFNEALSRILLGESEARG